MSVCCECCVLSGRDLCDELITRPEESYRLRYVVVCDLESSCMSRPWPTGGLLRQKQNKQTFFCIRVYQTQTFVFSVKHNAEDRFLFLILFPIQDFGWKDHALPAPEHNLHASLSLSLSLSLFFASRDSSVGVVTCYVLDCQGIESRQEGGGEIRRTRPGRPSGPTSLL